MAGYQKTNEEIEIMKIAGNIAAGALKKVLGSVKTGVKCSDLDKIAFDEIKNRGASPSFMTVDDYQWTICTTINEQVVHGIPTNRKLISGDILGVDIGALYEGFHSDLAITVPVGRVDRDTVRFLKVGKKTLEEAISAARAGAKVGDISQTIQTGIESHGYSIVKNLTGHGVGRNLHEEPMIPGFGKSGTGELLKENMVIAIEVIYTQGSGSVYVEDDNWTISSKDKSLGGLFEQTIVVTKNGPIVLTPYL